MFSLQIHSEESLVYKVKYHNVKDVRISIPIGSGYSKIRMIYI